MSSPDNKESLLRKKPHAARSLQPTCYTSPISDDSGVDILQAGELLSKPGYSKEALPIEIQRKHATASDVPSGAVHSGSFQCNKRGRRKNSKATEVAKDTDYVPKGMKRTNSVPVAEYCAKLRPKRNRVTASETETDADSDTEKECKTQPQSGKKQKPKTKTMRKYAPVESTAVFVDCPKEQTNALKTEPVSTVSDGNGDGDYFKLRQRWLKKYMTSPEAEILKSDEKQKPDIISEKVDVSSASSKTTDVESTGPNLKGEREVVLCAKLRYKFAKNCRPSTDLGRVDEILPSSGEQQKPDIINVKCENEGVDDFSQLLNRHVAREYEIQMQNPNIMSEAVDPLDLSYLSPYEEINYRPSTDLGRGDEILSASGEQQKLDITNVKCENDDEDDFSEWLKRNLGEYEIEMYNPNTMTEAVNALDISYLSPHEQLNYRPSTDLGRVDTILPASGEQQKLDIIIVKFENEDDDFLEWLRRNLAGEYMIEIQNPNTLREAVNALDIRYLSPHEQKMFILSKMKGDCGTSAQFSEGTACLLESGSLANFDGRLVKLTKKEPSKMENTETGSEYGNPEAPVTSFPGADLNPENANGVVDSDGVDDVGSWLDTNFPMSEPVHHVANESPIKIENTETNMNDEYENPELPFNSSYPSHLEQMMLPVTGFPEIIDFFKSYPKEDFCLESIQNKD